MTTIIGPKGPRGPIGPPGLPGEDYNPVMTQLATNVAIVTDTVTALPPDVGKYWVPFTSIIEAYNNPAIEFIVFHKTQPEVLPIGYELVGRAISIQAMTSSSPLQIPSLVDSFLTIVDAQILQSNVSITGTQSSLLIRNCESVSDQSITFSAVVNATVTILESQLNINQVLSEDSSTVRLLSSRLTLQSNTIFNATQATILSTGNTYTIPQGPTAALMSGGQYTISSTHDALRMMNTPNLDASSTTGLGLVSAMTVISNLTPIITYNDQLSSIVQPIDVNGLFLNTQYNQSGWYGYSLATATSGTTYFAGVLDRFVRVQNSSVNLLSVEIPGFEIVLAFDGSLSSRTIITTEWTYNVPNSPNRVKLIRMENRWVQFGS